MGNFSPAQCGDHKCDDNNPFSCGCDAKQRERRCANEQIFRLTPSGTGDAWFLFEHSDAGEQNKEKVDVEIFYRSHSTDPASSLAVADQMERDDKGASSNANSAAEHAPGQMKESGSAKDFAPGQRKEEGGSAKEVSPGHLKDNAASRSDDKGGLDRNSENSEGLKNKGSDRHSEGGTDRNLKADKSDHNAKNDRLEQSGKMKKDEQSRSETRNGNNSTGASEGSEGRSGGKGSVTGVTEEQRTRVKSVFIQHHVEPARGLNVSVNVGVALPHSVHLYPVPEDIVMIVPEYRGYRYILLEDNRVAIVDPDTFEVVDIIVIA